MSFEVWWLLYNLRFPDQQRFADKRVSYAIHPWLSYSSFISLNGETHEELLQTLDEVIGKMGRLASVNTRDEHGQTPLHLAVKKEGNKEVIRLLVESGASINTCDDKAYAALPQPAAVLKWGVQNKYIWIVPLLLDQDVDGMTGKPDYGQTTLELAVEYRSLFTINELVQNGVNVKTANGQRALMFVVGTQGLLYELDLEVAKWGGTDARGKTALYRAAEEWLPFVVKELAGKGVSIHAEYEVRSLSVQERDLQKWSVEQDDKFWKTVRSLMKRTGYANYYEDRKALLNRALENYIDKYGIECKCKATCFFLQCTCNSIELLRKLINLVKVLEKCMGKEVRTGLYSLKPVEEEVYFLIQALQLAEMLVNKEVVDGKGYA